MRKIIGVPQGSLVAKGYNGECLKIGDHVEYTDKLFSGIIRNIITGRNNNMDRLLIEVTYSNSNTYPIGYDNYQYWASNFRKV